MVHRHVSGYKNCSIINHAMDYLTFGEVGKLVTGDNVDEVGGHFLLIKEGKIQPDFNSTSVRTGK